MTKTFSANSNNDIFLDSSGNLAVANAESAVSYACASASKAQLGEMLYAINRGIPNFQSVWLGAPNLAVFESYLRDTLESVDGVVRVTSLTSMSQNNILSYSAEIETIYGRIALNG